MPDRVHLGAAADLAWKAQVVVSGVPVRVASNARQVTDAIARRYEAGNADAESDGCVVHVWVDSTVRDGPSEDTEVHWHLPSADRALVLGRGVAAALELDAGRGVARVDEWFVRHGAAFERTIVEGLVLLLVSRRDRHALHAAMIRAGDRALLLVGPSGVGKSTLAYLAYRDGLEVLTDDAARVQLEPRLRVWGDGTRARVALTPDARDRFPELRATATEVAMGGGVRKIVAELTPHGAAQPPVADDVRVCLLRRHAGPAERRSAAPEEIRAALANPSEDGFNLVPERHARVVEALARRGGWWLTLSSDPREALPHLHAMLRAAT